MLATTAPSCGSWNLCNLTRKIRHLSLRNPNGITTYLGKMTTKTPSSHKKNVYARCLMMRRRFNIQNSIYTLFSMQNKTSTIFSIRAKLLRPPQQNWIQVSIMSKKWDYGDFNRFFTELECHLEKRLAVFTFRRGGFDDVCHRFFLTI